MRRSGFIPLAILALAAVLTLLAIGPSGGPVPVDRAAADGPYGPSVKYCGKFRAGIYKIFVYKERVSCRKATKVMREYWLGPRRRKVIVNGGSGAYGYILLKRFPGWTCRSGSGGGSCSKGKRDALYQVR